MNPSRQEEKMYIIQGGAPLSGKVTPSGNKNEALPALCATLLTEEEITLENMPRIGDILTLIEIFSDMGVNCTWLDSSTLKVDAKNFLGTSQPSTPLCSKIRASILLLGSILARRGHLELPLPGGDVIGARRIDTHWENLELLGCSLQLIEGKIHASRGNRLKETVLYLDEPSVTATENLLLYCATLEETITIHNAASEPHVVGLGELLRGMGVEISGLGSNVLSIRGKKKLHGTKHRIRSDFMEIGSFLCLAACTSGSIEIDAVHLEDYRFILKTFARLGINPKTPKDRPHTFLLERDRSCPIIKKDINGRTPTVYSGPWPAFPTDLMSVAIVAATQSQGTVIFFEKMFEGRMFFTDKLSAMGANIVLCDPHRIVVTGPSPLFGTKMSSPDVRAGMALLIASLCAKGKSEIKNIYQIERGYFNIHEKLASLGAKIDRV